MSLRSLGRTSVLTVMMVLAVALGTAPAHALNLSLTARYGRARLLVDCLPTGAVPLWLPARLAVLGPALRAAEVPPEMATRSV